MKFNNLKEVIAYFSKINEGNYYLDYIVAEGSESIDWYKAILEKVKPYKPKRVVDIGSNANLFGYLFANEGIEYIGIDMDNSLKPIETDMIKFIHANYYDVREQFKDDICISCLCVGYLIPIQDVLCKKLIINSSTGTKENFVCTAKEIIFTEKEGVYNVK